MDTLNRKHSWSDIDRQNPFEVPENYFEDLSLRVADRIAAPKRAFAWSTVWQAARPLLAAAVVAFGCFFAWSHRSAAEAQDQYAYQNQTEEVVDRLLYMNSLADAMLTTDEFFTGEEWSSSDELTDDEMMYYLLNGNVEVGDIINMMYYAE